MSRMLKVLIYEDYDPRCLRTSVLWGKPRDVQGTAGFLKSQCGFNILTSRTILDDDLEESDEERPVLEALQRLEKSSAAENFSELVLDSIDATLRSQHPNATWLPPETTKISGPTPCLPKAVQDDVTCVTAFVMRIALALHEEEYVLRCKTKAS